MDDPHVVAGTSAVYVYCGKQLIRSRADAKYFVRSIDGTYAPSRGLIPAGAPGANKNRRSTHSPKQSAFSSSGRAKGAQ